MTPAERRLELFAELHVLRRLRAFLKLSRRDEEEFAILMRDYAELSRQMGATDQREFDALLTAWAKMN
jgi:hypothetical protein